MQLCQSLLDEPNIDTAVRLGDVYGLMIEHYGQTGDYKQVRSKYYRFILKPSGPMCACSIEMLESGLGMKRKNIKNGVEIY